MAEPPLKPRPAVEAFFRYFEGELDAHFSKFSEEEEEASKPRTPSESLKRYLEYERNLHETVTDEIIVTGHDIDLMMAVYLFEVWYLSGTSGSKKPVMAAYNFVTDERVNRWIADNSYSILDRGRTIFTAVLQMLSEISDRGEPLALIELIVSGDYANGIHVQVMNENFGPFINAFRVVDGRPRYVSHVTPSVPDSDYVWPPEYENEDDDWPINEPSSPRTPGLTVDEDESFSSANEEDEESDNGEGTPTFVGSFPPIRFENEPGFGEIKDESKVAYIFQFAKSLRSLLPKTQKASFLPEICAIVVAINTMVRGIPPSEQSVNQLVRIVGELFASREMPMNISGILSTPYSFNYRPQPETIVETDPESGAPVKFNISLLQLVLQKKIISELSKVYYYEHCQPVTTVFDLMIRETIMGMDQLFRHANQTEGLVRETKSAEDIFSAPELVETFRVEATKIQLEANKLAEPNNGQSSLERGVRKMGASAAGLMLGAAILASGVVGALEGASEGAPEGAPEQPPYGDIPFLANWGQRPAPRNVDLWGIPRGIPLPSASNLDSGVYRKKQRRHRPKPSYFDHAL